MYLGFRATNEYNLKAKEGQNGEDPKEETRMIRGVIFLVLPGAWNVPCTYQRDICNITSMPMR